VTYGELEYDIALEHRGDPEILNLVKLTTIEPHDGSFLDATVTVTLDDGTQILAIAANLIFPGSPLRRPVY
jgi:hypothetical protein